MIEIAVCAKESLGCLNLGSARKRADELGDENSQVHANMALTRSAHLGLDVPFPRVARNLLVLVRLL